jgi:putative SOS response-associated peptidase YedK
MGLPTRLSLRPSRTPATLGQTRPVSVAGVNLRPMCNHFRSDPEWRDLTEDYSEVKIRTRFPQWDRAPGSNRPPLQLYPGRNAPVVRVAEAPADGKDLEQVDMRWGFIPGSHKGTVSEFRIQGRKHLGLTNCRDPRDSKDGQVNWFCRWAFKERRCIVPATGFYEYDARGAKGSKEEFLFTLPGESVFFLAGLWERVNAPDGPVDTFAFMTTAPGEMVKPYHPKAEPVILEPGEALQWLDHTADPLALIKNARDGRLAVTAAKEAA